MNILVLDPGVTTGYVLYTKNYGIAFGQRQPDEIWELLENAFFPRLTRTAIIVYETFDYRRHKLHADLTPVEVIGVIKEFVRQNPYIILQSQKPAQAVGPQAFWNDNRLREQGMYYKGMQHARDAARHWLYWLYFGEGKEYAEIPRKGLQPQKG